MTHNCHARGCTRGAHAEMAFCQEHTKLLPRPHVEKMWELRLRGACQACDVPDLNDPGELERKVDTKDRERRLRWLDLYDLAVAILLEVEHGGCGAPDTMVDEQGFCWFCGVQDARRQEERAKKVIAKFGLKKTG